jgi:hypothetical protein
MLQANELRAKDASVTKLRSEGWCSGMRVRARDDGELRSKSTGDESRRDCRQRTQRAADCVALSAGLTGRGVPGAGPKSPLKGRLCSPPPPTKHGSPHPAAVACAIAVRTRSCCQPRRLVHSAQRRCSEPVSQIHLRFSLLLWLSSVHDRAGGEARLHAGVPRRLGCARSPLHWVAPCGDVGVLVWVWAAGLGHTSRRGAHTKGNTSAQSCLSVLSVFLVLPLLPLPDSTILMLQRCPRPLSAIRYQMLHTQTISKPPQQ